MKLHLHEKAGIADVRLCVLQIPNGTLAAAKEAASKQMVEVLHAYRRNCSTQSAPGQLVLPEALKLSPLYNLSLSKCPAFRWAMSLTGTQVEQTGKEAQCLMKNCQKTPPAQEAMAPWMTAPLPLGGRHHALSLFSEPYCLLFSRVDLVHAGCWLLAGLLSLMIIWSSASA